MNPDYSAYEVIMIVHELHQRGYEQLRLFPGISPNGMCWRWMIYPKQLMQDMVIVLHLNVCVVLLVLLSQKKGRILKLLMTS